MNKLIMLGLLIILSGSVYAQWNYGKGIYRWVDATGEVHYSRYPPAHITDYEEIKQTWPVVSVPADDAKQSDGQAEADGHRQAVSAPDIEAAIKQNCFIASQNKVLLESSDINITFTNEAGETSDMDEEQRQKQLAEAEDHIKQYCR